MFHNGLNGSKNSNYLTFRLSWPCNSDNAEFQKKQEEKYAESSQLPEGSQLQQGSQPPQVHNKRKALKENIKKGDELSLDTKSCPDCSETGYWYPEGVEKGVAKCKHERMVKTVSESTER